MRAAVLLVFTLACNPRELEDAVAKAPVRSMEIPGGFRSGDMRVVLPLPAPPVESGVAARLLVAGTEMGSLAIFHFDRAGKAKAYVASDPGVKELLADNTPVAGAALLESGKVLLGTPNYAFTSTGRTVLLDVAITIDGSPKLTASKHFEPTGEHRRLGLAVAAGAVSGGPAEDHVIVGDGEVVLVEDGDTTRPIFSDPTCPLAGGLALPAVYSLRAVAVGDLLAGGGDEIAVGVPHDATPGQVVILTKVGAQLGCPVILTGPASANERHTKFGASLAIADLDGDGRPELIVGSPGDGVLVYQTPISVGASPRSIKPPGAAPGEFGYRVSALELSGLTGRTLAVTSPELAVGGKTSAGQVTLFNAQGSPLATIAPKDPGDNALFGSSVAALRFSVGACGGIPAAEHRLLVVGAVREVFTYFRFPAIAPREPRCFTP
jgi:hypothetical protein